MRRVKVGRKAVELLPLHEGGTGNTATRLLTVDAPHFNAGVELRCTKYGAHVVMAAPIVRYMTGWDEGRVRNYCTGRGWKVTEVLTCVP